MQDGEHDALPIAGTSSDSRYFVVATLAAIVLAGGAFVYRSRSPYHKQAEHDHHRNKVPLRVQPQPDDEPDAPQPPSVVSAVNDQESKESKRSKDRRRRGKDPLKEIFKSGKKLKGITLSPSKTPAAHSGSEDHDAADHSGSGLVPLSSDDSPARKSSVDPIPLNPGKRSQRVQQSNSSTAEMSAGTPLLTRSHGPSEVSESPHDRNNHPSFAPSSTSSASDDGHRSHSPLTSQDDREGGDAHNSAPLLIQAHQAVLSPTDVPTSVPSPPRSVPSPPAPHSPTASSATNTTTTNSVIIPATSPTLSQTSTIPSVSGSSPTIGSPAHVPLAISMKPRNSPRKQLQLSSNAKKTQSPYGWDWDGASDHTTIVSSDPPVRSNIVYPKPPRLQPKGLKATDTPLSFSAAAAHVPNATIYASSSMTNVTTSHASSSMSDDGHGNSSMSSSISHSVSIASKDFAATSSSSVGTTELSASTNRTSIPPSPPLSAAVEASDEQAIHLTFPTLNPTVTTPGSSGSNGASSSGTKRPRSENANNQQQSNTNSVGHAPSTPKSVPTRDRRPATPSSSTPPPNSCNSSNSASGMPALSTQTQLASLRGALEAARLREEKNKADMERCVKEMDILRWENMNCKRGEAELQAHIQQLTHQLQTYAALFAAMAPHLNSQLQRQHQQGNGNTIPNVTGSAGSTSGTPNAASASATPNGYAGSSAGSISSSGTASSPQSQPQTPSSHQQQQLASPVLPPPNPTLPLHIQMLNSLHLSGVPSPVMGGSGMMSPTPGMQPLSPFFPYPVPGPHPQNFLPLQHSMMGHQFPQSLPHMQPLPQSPVQPQPSPHQHQGMFSMLFSQQQTVSMHSPTSNPNAQASSSVSMGSLSRPSSNAGSTSSVGSPNPDSGGSPSPAFGMPATRRSRARTQAQASNGRVGGRAAWEDVSDGWIGPTIGEGEEDGVADAEDEGGFNEILADAILKRPDSIRVRTSSKRSKMGLGGKNDALRDKDGHGRESSASRSSDQDHSSEEVEELKEFTFPSLSDLGNVRQRSLGAPQSNGDNSVASSSSPSSPTPVSTPASDNLFGFEAEEPRVTLPSVEEQVETGESHIEINDPLINADHYDHKEVLSSISSPESDATPRKEELEPSLTESTTEEITSIETTVTGDVALVQ